MIKLTAGKKIRHVFTGIEYEILKEGSNVSSRAIITKVPKNMTNFADVGESFNVWPDFMEDRHE